MTIRKILGSFCMFCIETYSGNNQIILAGSNSLLKYSLSVQNIKKSVSLTIFNFILYHSSIHIIHGISFVYFKIKIKICLKENR